MKMKKEDTWGHHKAVDDYLAELGIRVKIEPFKAYSCPERCAPYSFKQDGIRVQVEHNHGYRYSLRLERTRDGHNQSFVIEDFWNSFNSRYVPNKIQERLVELQPTVEYATPSAYDVLSTLSPDFYSNQETFEYWAKDRGYDTDSIKARDNWMYCVDLAIRVQRFFSAEELEKLSELAS